MIYLDNASTSYPKSDSVAQAAHDAVLKLANPNRGGYEPAVDAARTIHMARIAVAQVFSSMEDRKLHGEDCGALNVAFTSGATESLNLVINGLIRPQDHVITTTAEHNSVLRPLYYKRCDLSIVKAGDFGEGFLERVETQINSNTKAVVCTHGSNVTGNVVDVSALANVCKQHGILLILDVAATVGHVDLQNTAADAVCISAHKGLGGIAGTGAVYAKEHLQFMPTKVGGTGEHTLERWHSTSMPGVLEAGSPNMVGIAALLAAIKQTNLIGIEKIMEKETELERSFVEQVRQIPKIKLHGNVGAANRLPIVSISVDGADSSTISELLWDRYEVATRGGLHCAPLMHDELGTLSGGLVRFSFSYKNRQQEVQEAVSALADICKNSV